MGCVSVCVKTKNLNVSAFSFTFSFDHFLKFQPLFPFQREKEATCRWLPSLKARMQILILLVLLDLLVPPHHLKPMKCEFMCVVCSSRWRLIGRSVHVGVGSHWKEIKITVRFCLRLIFLRSSSLKHTYSISTEWFKPFIRLINPPYFRLFSASISLLSVHLHSASLSFLSEQISQLVMEATAAPVKAFLLHNFY